MIDKMVRPKNQQIGKKAVQCFLISIICSSFFTITSADLFAESTVFSHGDIIYEQSRALTLPPITATNFALVPDEWSGPGKLQIGGNPDIIYPSDAYNGTASIKLQQTSSWKAEVNCGVIRVYPGDRVIMRCWIKTSYDTALQGSGARIGADLSTWNYTYVNEDNSTGHGFRICGVQSEVEAESGRAADICPQYSDEVEEAIVKWGTTSWVLREWDFIVPEYAYGDGWVPLGQTGQYFIRKGEPAKIFWFAPWVQIMGTNVAYNAAWFANFEFNIYRNGAWL